MLFIDCEFVDNQEIIELSVWNLRGEEVYHEFFKPAGIRRWPTSMAIHHISPEDVKDSPSFASRLPEIQRLFDNSRYIIGFATKGDVNHLTHMGVKGLHDKHIIDVKQMYWLYYGLRSGMDYYSLPGLSRCAEDLGIEFGDRGAHSASEDTLVTLRCFEVLCDRIEGQPYADRSEESFIKAMDIYQEEFAREKENYERNRAIGWITVTLLPDGLYRVQFKHTEPEESPELVLKVKVDDMAKAEAELHVQLQKRQTPNRRSVYRLTKADLRRLRAYTNSFETAEDHDLNRKLLKLQRQWP